MTRSAPRLTALAVILLALLVQTVTTATATPAPPDDGEGGGQGRLLLVLDASGSMKEPAGNGRNRFQAATGAVRQVLDALPDDLEVGLRVYGARIADGPGSCQDSELVVPVSPLDRDAIRTALADARPLGNTPLAHSLEAAAGDLPEDGQRTILLISDGEESCGGDPCQVARDLSAQGYDVRVDVIGFQVTGRARDELTCIAQAGRGTFYDAPDAAALASQLRRLSSRAARAYAPAGIPVEGAPDVPGAPTLEEQGQYLDTIGDSGESETYLLHPQRGATVHVSATLRPTLSGATDSEAVEVTVTSADGTSCLYERTSGLGAFDRLTPVTAGGTLSAEDLAGCGRAPYALRATRVEGSGVKPLEVVYVVEPPVTDTTALPTAAEEGSYDVRAAVTGPAAPAVGAPSFTAAPVLEPGRYRDSILVGETLFYAVQLDWGQQLVCDVQFAPSPAVSKALGFTTPTAAVRVYGPTRERLADLSFNAVDNAFYEEGRTAQVHVATPPVRYLNREASLYAIAASLPGTYYCGAFLNGSTRFASAGEVPLTVTLDVVGTAGEGAPQYDESFASPSAAPSKSAKPAAGDASAPDSDGGVPWWAWLVVVLVVAGTTGFLLARRRQSERAGS